MSTCVVIFLRFEKTKTLAHRYPSVIFLMALQIVDPKVSPKDIPIASWWQVTVEDLPDSMLAHGIRG